MGTNLSKYIASGYYGPEDTTLDVRDDHDPNVIHKVTMKEFVESRCPTLFENHPPAWWLYSGHFQTAYCVMGDFSKIDPIVYERTLLRVRDGGTVGLDFTLPDPKCVYEEDTPMIVVMHGLTGGSYESYVRSVFTPVISPVEQGGLGWRGVVVNFRGCAGVPVTSGQLYSAGHTEDLRQALTFISLKYPKAPLIGVGFSLGANVITRYLGEEGERSRLIAACVLGCPWDLVANMKRLDEDWFLREVYSRGMGGNLVNIARLHVDALSKLPEDRRLTPILPELFAMKNPTLLDVDSVMTRMVGGMNPPFPFATAWDYYAWGSSHEHLANVRVPLLCINADDDPIVGNLPYKVGGNALVALAVTRGGGHLGWFESDPVRGGVTRWVSAPVVEYLRAIGESYVSKQPEPVEVEVVDGWIRETWFDQNLGYKEVEHGAKIHSNEGIGEGGLLAGL